MAVSSTDFWMSGAEARELAWEDRDMNLPGRGSTSVRIVEGPRPDAPSLLLLHGLGATGRLNWFSSIGTLAAHFRLVVVDHRGHGRGIRTNHFRLVDCADDAIAVADELGIDSMIAVGYSMGGPIAKLCWSRHPSRVRGLVLCATANHFVRAETAGLATAVFPGIVMTARMAPRFFMNRIIDSITVGIPPGERLDAVTREMSGSDPATLMQATRAVLRFSSRDWAADIDVPTAVIVTTKDQVVPPRRQRLLAETIEQAKVYSIPGDHLACANNASRFVPTLLQACRYVDEQASVLAGTSLSHSA